MTVSTDELSQLQRRIGERLHADAPLFDAMVSDYERGAVKIIAHAGVDEDEIAARLADVPSNTWYVVPGPGPKMRYAPIIDSRRDPSRARGSSAVAIAYSPVDRAARDM
jgi:hypothetical protein